MISNYSYHVYLTFKLSTIPTYYVDLVETFVVFLCPFRNSPRTDWYVRLAIPPLAGSGVVRMDPLRFLAGYKATKQSLSVLSKPRFFWSVSVVLLARAPFCVVLFCVVCSVSWSFLLGCQYQCK